MHVFRLSTDGISNVGNRITAPSTITSNITYTYRMGDPKVTIQSRVFHPVFPVSLFDRIVFYALAFSVASKSAHRAKNTG